MKRFAFIFVCAIFFCRPMVADAEEALIAVATNFHPILVRLRDEFEATSSHHVELSGGSTGVLYAQITNGAPYDAFFAADQLRPEQLEEDGTGVADSRFTYAEGRLAFW
ncbi:MAG: substrate-binding domain-containing protein, partial [Gammaproteobacteria bacterium]|nr:substrate-binding domain-containing protein [Gammaproteobacteria bacterium]